MAKFADYLDQYPDVLPGQLRGASLFKSPVDDTSFFEQFLALQANPNAAILQRINLPDRLKQFMSLSGGQ